MKLIIHYFLCLWKIDFRVSFRVSVLFHIDSNTILWHNAFKPYGEWIFQEESFFATQLPEDNCVAFFIPDRFSHQVQICLNIQKESTTQKGRIFYGTDFYERKKDIAPCAVHVHANGNIHGSKCSL